MEGALTHEALLTVFCAGDTVAETDALGYTAFGRQSCAVGLLVPKDPSADAVNIAAGVGPSGGKSSLGDESRSIGEVKLLEVSEVATV